MLTPPDTCSSILKAHSLYMCRDYAAKLADVGIARRLLDSQVRTVGTTVGTWGWAAPETILRDYPITGKADIYSMGVIIWELHTGEIPLGRIIRCLPSIVCNIAPKHI